MNGAGEWSSWIKLSNIKFVQIARLFRANRRLSSKGDSSARAEPRDSKRDPTTSEALASGELSSLRNRQTFKRRLPTPPPSPQVQAPVSVCAADSPSSRQLVLTTRIGRQNVCRAHWNAFGHTPSSAKLEQLHLAGVVGLYGDHGAERWRGAICHSWALLQSVTRKRRAE
jgi:hypothetical protein